MATMTEAPSKARFSIDGQLTLDSFVKLPGAIRVSSEALTAEEYERTHSDLVRAPRATGELDNVAFFGAQFASSAFTNVTTVRIVPT